MVTGPTSQALWGRGAGGVETYLLGTVWQGCKLIKRCWNLPPGLVRGMELDTVLLSFEG